MGTYTDLIKLQRKPSSPTVPVAPVVNEVPPSTTEQRVYPDPTPISAVTPTAEEKVDPVVSRYHDTVIPTDQLELMKRVRKAVKEFGKEAATHRFTQAEKKAVAEIVYTYKRQGIRTSENEIARIAINFLFFDYKINGQNSILHKALLSLQE